LIVRRWSGGIAIDDDLLAGGEAFVTRQCRPGPQRHATADAQRVVGFDDRRNCLRPFWTVVLARRDTGRVDKIPARSRTTRPQTLVLVVKRAFRRIVPVAWSDRVVDHAAALGQLSCVAAVGAPASGCLPVVLRGCLRSSPAGRVKLTKMASLGDRDEHSVVRRRTRLPLSTSALQAARLSATDVGVTEIELGGFDLCRVCLDCGLQLGDERLSAGRSSGGSGAGWNELRISFEVGLGTGELRFVLLLRRFPPAPATPGRVADRSEAADLPP